MKRKKTTEKAPRHDLTSEQMSYILTQSGLALGAAAVRRWWQRGAPRHDANAFLDYYKANRESHKEAPLVKTPIDQLSDCARGSIRLLHELESALSATEEYFDHRSKSGPLIGVDWHAFFLYRALQKVRNFSQLTLAFYSTVELHRNPKDMPPEAREMAERIFNGDGFDFRAACADLGVQPSDLEKA